MSQAQVLDRPQMQSLPVPFNYQEPPQAFHNHNLATNPTKQTNNSCSGTVWIFVVILVLGLFILLVLGIILAVVLVGEYS